MLKLNESDRPSSQAITDFDYQKIKIKLNRPRAPLYQRFIGNIFSLKFDSPNFQTKNTS